jgi:competence protein ComEC
VRGLAAALTMTRVLAAVACGGPSSSDDAGSTTAPSSATAPTSVADASTASVTATAASSVDTGPPLTTAADTSSSTTEPGTTGDPPQGSLEIWWIDVEGGAATLFVTPDGTLVLADMGFPGDRDADRIAAVIQDEVGADGIDLAIVTHYHSDHVGGLPDLVERIPITAFWDHGDSVEARGGDGQMLWNDYLAIADGKRTTVAPGETHDIGGLQLDIVSSNAQTLAAPLPGGGAPNPACDGADTPGPEFNENPMSVGFVARFGTFDMLDLGDLTWSYEHDLVCPENLLGPIDLYQTTHHGQSNSGATQLVHGIDPVVAIMNNGPHKGGAPETWDRISTSPSSPDLWQLHRALDTDDAHNSEDDLIVNPQDADADEGHALHVLVDASGRITVTNRRNLHSRIYQSK